MYCTIIKYKFFYKISEPHREVYDEVVEWLGTNLIGEDHYWHCCEHDIMLIDYTTFDVYITSYVRFLRSQDQLLFELAWADQVEVIESLLDHE